MSFIDKMQKMKIKDLSSIVKVFYNRETAASIVYGQLDAATRTRSVAK